MMKLYGYPSAPNPRRVEIFIREKGLGAEEVEIITCDIMKGEHKSDEFLKKNPSGKIPVLETGDGRFIPESIAICRYLEAIVPEPNLFGANPYELGAIEARNRHMEFELWMPVGTSWVNGPIVGRMGRFKQNPQAKEASDRAVHRFYERLDNEFRDTEYVAGDRFTVADITALSAIDFAASMVGLRPDDSLKHLWRWHALMYTRPSVDRVL